jgi:hypothetical protein
MTESHGKAMTRPAAQYWGPWFFLCRISSLCPLFTVSHKAPKATPFHCAIDLCEPSISYPYWAEPLHFSLRFSGSSVSPFYKPDSPCHRSYQLFYSPSRALQGTSTIPSCQGRKSNVSFGQVAISDRRTFSGKAGFLIWEFLLAR